MATRNGQNKTIPHTTSALLTYAFGLCLVVAGGRSFALADATLGPWEYTNSLQAARAGHGMAAGPSSLYVIGGQGEGLTPLSSVEYATAASDGTLSSWQFTAPLHVSRVLTTAAATASHVYAIGGASHPALVGFTLASVEYAPILPDGSVGAWSFTSALSTGRANAVALVSGQFLYVVGGFGNGQLDTVERAALLADGSLGAWSVLDARLTVPRERPGAVIVGDTMVVVGGLSAAGGGILKTTEFAPLRSDGALGAWQLGSPLTTPRYHGSAVGTDSRVFALGGYNDGEVSAWATTEESVLNETGPETWTNGSPMHEPRAYGAATVLNGQVYIAGGVPVPTNPQDLSATVERAALLPLDRDSDGIPDADEPCLCLGTQPGQVVTAIGCSVKQICPCEAPLGRTMWSTHAEYLACVRNASAELLEDEVLTKAQRRELLRQAQPSACGR